MRFNSPTIEKKINALIDESDIDQILLKSSSDLLLTIRVSGIDFYSGTYFWGSWNKVTSRVDFSGPYYDSEIIIGPVINTETNVEFERIGEQLLIKMSYEHETNCVDNYYCSKADSSTIEKLP